MSLRALARWIGAAAAALAPSNRQAWSQAMMRELDEIGHDLTAVKWAAGCLLCSMHERTSPMLAKLVRWGVAGAALLCGLNNAYATSLLIGHRLGFPVLEATSNARLSLILTVTPDAILALWASVVILFAAAAVQIFRARPSGPWLLMAAFAAWLVQTTHFHATPFFHDNFPRFIFLFDYLLFAVLAAMTVASWRLMRAQDGPRAA